VSSSKTESSADEVVEVGEEIGISSLSDTGSCLASVTGCDVIGTSLSSGLF